MMMGGLMLNHAEHVQGVGLIRLSCENLLIESSRLRKPAGLVMPDGQKVGLLGRHTKLSDVQLFAFPKRRNRLAAREARLHLMPVPDVFFAQLPAEADVVTLVPASKIDQAGLIVLQLAANLRKL